MNAVNLTKKKEWAELGVAVPSFDYSSVIRRTLAAPTWVHFGAGNLFRAFIAELQQLLLEAGKVDTGIIATDTFDFDLIDQIYKPYDNLTLLVSLKPDGTTVKKIIASIGESIKGDTAGLDRLRTIFTSPTLQMASFTITEKGYSLVDLSSQFLPVVKADLTAGPDQAKHVMSIITALLYSRYQAGKLPLALVSMDNCSQNGAKLQSSVLTIAEAWLKKGFVDEGFLCYLRDQQKISFPWSMIDKITPRPSEQVEKHLTELGIEGMSPLVTSKNTFVAPFVNTEIPHYLVIEDQFPNGRPPLEEAGVYFTDRETVQKTERMKVTTCLNPLHTALAVFGCLLGYDSIAAEMKDTELKALVEKIGYEEGMPVVVDPKIISPQAFIHEVITERLPNPFIPDSPFRIATDTSQKMPVRFGETIKSYIVHPDLKVTDLFFIPLVIAGWCRYLLGVDDKLITLNLSSDPMLPELRKALAGIKVGIPQSYQGQLRPILANPVLFGVDLWEVGLGKKIEGLFLELIAGKGAVRQTLVKYLSTEG
ncbi:MAG TPA: mannitol dehydrogenase family protein [Firmicutes bacterium]|jgi:fructuronate reductase|nr:mannitol dehydrogenase family protein [Bacillota bacterium]